MDKLKKSLENPETANIIAETLANLALISITLSQIGFESHLEHATALTQALAEELEALANDISEGNSDSLSELLDGIERLYNEGDNKVG